MLSFHITDRRKNPSGKNLNNRKRFIDRVKKNIDVTKGLKKRGIDDQSDEEVSVSRDGIKEPSFQYDRKNGGIWDHILPGNKEYNVGDTIARPPGGAGGGHEGSPDGEGDDDFLFSLTHDEYMDILFADLALPDMVKDTEKHIMSWTMRRAGYTPVGAASNLALEQSMIKSISRRLALKNPKLALIAELEEELENEKDEKRKIELEEQIAELRVRASAIPFLDKTDLRYHNTIRTPLPITQAVMICAMDTSGSMTEHMKDLAKRFYILLHLFLKRIYKDVEIVFIRHTHEAEVVDEDTFFHSPETGGTVVSTAYDVAKKEILKRFPVDEWNIYMAQVSDGDNTSQDNDVSKKFLNDLLPWLQYLTYVEVAREWGGGGSYDSEVWKMMLQMEMIFPNKIAMRKLKDKNEVFEVFRSLFVKKQETK
jgi:uncharacterized sporulation protein YeaH/YhbH (DUF444 family)